MTYLSWCSSSVSLSSLAASFPTPVTLFEPAPNFFTVST